MLGKLRKNYVAPGLWAIEKNKQPIKLTNVHIAYDLTQMA